MAASNGTWTGSAGWGCEYVARKPTTQPIASVEHIGESSGAIKPVHRRPHKIFLFSPPFRIPDDVRSSCFLFAVVSIRTIASSALLY